MNSSVTMGIVSLQTGLVTASMTVLMVQMRTKISVLCAHSNTSVQMEDAQIQTMFAMEEISAEITAMKLKFVTSVRLKFVGMFQCLENCCKYGILVHTSYLDKY